MANAYGRWSIVRPLGGGGNANVYVASDGVAEVALKVLHLGKQSPESEAYRRFRDEVIVQRELTARPGILPLLDAYLPQSPSKKDPAWLVTPLATPLEHELGTPPDLRRVVEAMAELAEVLAGLADEGISHRDIKPNNLYAYQGSIVVGDFGLVSYPEKEAVTDGARAVGPIHFQAPEMVVSPETADGRPADVYSLAKTLWVLAAGQRYHYPGEHRLDLDQMLLRQYTSDPRAEYLDHLIARCTRFYPTSRPSMHEVAEELRAWLAPSQPSSQLSNVSQAAKRLEVLSAAGRREQLDREEYKAQFRFALENLQRLLGPLRDDLANQGFSEAALNSSNPTALESSPARGTASTTVIGSDGVSLVVQLPGGAEPILWSGVGLRLFDDGMLQIVASLRMRRPGYDRGESLWSQDAVAFVSSAKAEAESARLIAQLVQETPGAIERYVDAVEEAKTLPLPLPDHDLSPAGQLLAALLSRESVDAFAEHFTVTSLVERLVMAERDLVGAADELQRKGWVNLLKDGNSAFGVYAVSTTPVLFLRTEAKLHGGDPKADAIHFIAEPIDAGRESIAVEERARTLGWTPRRTNIACYFLDEYSGVDRTLESSSKPYAYASLSIGPNARDFLRRRR